MAKHEIRCYLPAAEIVNRDVTFSIWSDDKLLGKLDVSKGSIDWVPSNATANYYAMSWEKFAALIVEHGKKEKCDY